MPPTIKDISREARVSIATVSKVLNGDYSKVSDETKQRVLDVAERLQYRPNLLARSLVRRQSSLLGLVVPDISNPYYADMCRGIADEAQKHRLSTLIVNTNRQAKSEQLGVRTMVEYNVAGVALIGMFSQFHRHLDMLRRYGVPYVVLEHHEPGLDHTVYVDDYSGSHEAVSYLVQLNHRVIGYISGFSEKDREKDMRLKGYRQALQEAGLPEDPTLVEHGRFDIDTGHRKAAALLARHPGLSAIACGNDLIALGAFQALREKGCRIPEDISLIGFDDVYLSTAMEPRLTTVRQPAYELGVAAGRMLARQIAKEPLEDTSICFKPTLIKRDTVSERRG